MRQSAFAGLIISFFLVSCIHPRTFVLSPYHATAPTYRPVIIQKDSLRSAFNAGLTLLPAAAVRDADIFAVNLDISRSHAFKHFGLRYGASLQLGSYKMEKPDTFGTTNPMAHQYLYDNAGKYAANGYGLDGAVHWVVSNKNYEFRPLGFEFTVNREFGDFVKMRKATPATDPSKDRIIIDREELYATAGGYMEFINTEGSYKGLKIGYGRALRPSVKTRKTNGAYDVDNFLNYRYFTLVSTWSSNKWTFFFQTVFASKGGSGQFGASYRL